MKKWRLGEWYIIGFLYERAMRELQEMGEAACKPMYMHFAAGLYPAYPDGSADDVHTQLAGARYYARITAELLHHSGLI